jgi:thiamine biosynthesis lipoprotein
MGTVFRIVLFAPDEGDARAAAEEAFARIRELDEKLSDYDRESELSRLCARAAESAPTPAVEVSADLIEVLNRAQEIARRSAGAFDPTLGSLVRLWRRSARQGELPTPARLAEAREAAGFEKLELDLEGRRVRLLARGLALDLGGVGKGFACDQALACLARAGFPSALVDGGGDLALGRAPPGEAGWIVELTPFGAGSSAALSLSNCGVATSGDRYQSVEIDGRVYSHVLDVRTGLGLERRVAVTVIAPDATAADAWATALSVLDPAAGIELMEELEGHEARVLVLDPGGREPLESHETRTFGAALLATPPPRAGS